MRFPGGLGAGAVAVAFLGGCGRGSTVASGTAITSVAVVDLASGSILADRTVVFDGPRITLVAPSADVALGPKVARISGVGKFLIPGLWDMHVHLSPMLGGPDILPVFTAYGVTGVRDMGSQDSIYRWRREVARSERIGPRIVAAGPMLVSWTTIQEAGPTAGVTPIHSETEAREAVEAHRRDAQFIKLQDSFLPRSLWLAAAVAAAEARLPLVSHVPMGLTLREAIEAGVKDIEHTVGLAVAVVPGEADRRRRIMERAHPPGSPHTDIYAGYTALFDVEAEVWDTAADSAWDDLGRLMAGHGVALDPTLTDLRAVATGASGRWNDDPRLAYLPPPTRASWVRQATGELFSPKNSRRAEVLLARISPIVARLHARGVTVLAGTDAGSPFDFPGSDIHSELALLVDAGLTPLAALRAATVDPARFMGMADSAGAIGPGMLADLVLLDANPLADIRNSGRIAAVVQAGRAFGRAALDSILTAAAERAGRL